MTNNKYVLAAALSLTTLGAAIVSTPVASAQRPAIIKNIDEKGRTPFQKTLLCSSPSSGFCSSIFPPVPANKRLVVEYVNAFFSSPAGANPSVILTAQFNTETSFANRGHADIVQLLLADHADVNARNSEGMTPLYGAAEAGYTEVTLTSVPKSRGGTASNTQSVPVPELCSRRRH